MLHAPSSGLLYAGIGHEVRLVQSLAARVGGPVHLVGHSFGGTVALAAALTGSVQVASLALFEANPLDIVRGSGEGDAVYHDMLEMRVASSQLMRSIRRRP